MTKTIKQMSKIRFSQNWQISVWNTNFVPRQAIASISFVLLSTYTGDTLFRVWFNLKNFLTQPKRTIFKIRYSRNYQISVQKTNFLPRQALAKKFVSSYTLATKGIHYTQFGSIWTTFRPNEKDLFLKFLSREIQKLTYAILTFLKDKP